MKSIYSYLRFHSKPLSSQQVLWRHYTLQSSVSHSLNLQLSTICPNQQWNISHSSAMMRANQGFLATLCPWGWCKNPNPPLIYSIFRENSGPIRLLEHKRGIDYSQTTDVALFVADEGRERGNSTWARERGLHGEIWILFFACRTSLWNTCVDQRQCETCVLTSSKHVSLMLGSASGVCYTAVCLQVAGHRRVVSSGLWVI